MERVAQSLDWIGRMLAWIGIAVVAILPLPIAYDAIARSFGRPTIWVFEVSLYGLIAAGFLSNAMALASGSHFRITFLGRLLPRLRPVLDRLSLLVTLAFSGVLVYAAWHYLVLYSWSFGIVSNTLLSVPQFLPQLALLIGGVALGLQTVSLLLRGRMPEHDIEEAVETDLQSSSDHRRQ